MLGGRWRRKKFLLLAAFLFPFIIFQVSDLNRLKSEQASPTDKYDDEDDNDKQSHGATTTFLMPLNHTNQSPHNQDLVKTVDFDPEKHFIVFFHIQKTSGTNYDLEMVATLHYRREATTTYEKACKDVKVVNPKILRRTVYMTEYSCKKNNSNITWLFSWHENSFGWQCGLHPYLVDLRPCIERKISEKATSEKRVNDIVGDSLKDKIFHISMLRDPLTRFVSEYLHVKKTGSIWVYEQPAASKGHECALTFASTCLGRLKSWKGVKWETFVNCKHNLAFNRQTIMLAEYDESFSLCSYFDERSRHGANNRPDHESELLERAIRGLHSLTFFGLTEYQNYSKLLMERTFNDKFKYKPSDKFTKQQKLLQSKSQTSKFMKQLSAESIRRVKQANRLDFELYEYAKDLFLRRLKHFNIVPQNAKLL